MGQNRKILGHFSACSHSSLSSRTDNAVKNHWNSTIKRKVDTGSLLNETKESNPLYVLVKLEGQESQQEQEDENQV